jgi:hypothetical protein
MNNNITTSYIAKTIYINIRYMMIIMINIIILYASLIRKKKPS